MNSSTVAGGKSRGSVFIRGIKSDSGFDSFKFVLEKMVDFAELDSDLVLNAVEHCLKMQQNEEEHQREDAKPRFSARNNKKSQKK